MHFILFHSYVIRSFCSVGSHINRLLYCTSKTQERVATNKVVVTQMWTCSKMYAYQSVSVGDYLNLLPIQSP